MKEQSSLRSITLSNDILLGSVVEMVGNGSVVKINISGSSMKPFLYNGDSILLKKVAKQNIYLGDIVLGKYHNNYVLHRVVRIENDCVFLAGDNNLSQIERIEEENICAIAIALVTDEGNKDLTTNYRRFLGLLWYCLRPFRKVYFKIFK